ncbi:tyrosine-protein phosphatase [Mangrovimonas aestuarii]|uniref:tyrosine-protein phosphatase n=1 Tax=Mangrovimonas aestuarii TaxID=3018443 RepID=UPI0023798E6D|nr:CpsB/CapC family capsule biosynthesis tyrosine phosphatase [Mangrovimonas aestuarii]
MRFSFKKKPELANLIPNNYVDIHSHILPQIDDGAQSISDTKILLKAMSGFGFETVIGTPHTLPNVWDSTKESIEQALINARQGLPLLSKQLNLRCASEYLLDPALMNRLENEKLLTIKDNYVLVEMSYLNPPMGLYEYIFELQHQGYIPILAHPERYRFYHNNFKQYEKLKQTGCLFQVNLLSTVGYYGKSIYKTAEKLLNEGFIDYTGSDIHHLNHINAFNKPVLLKKTDALQKAMENNSLIK